MKLSMWSSYYSELSPEDAILELEKYGYTYSELSDEHSMMLLERGDPTEVGKKYKEFANAHNVVFPQGHLKLGARLCEKEDRELLKRQLDLFLAVGVKNAVLHYDALKRYDEVNDEDAKRRNAEALKDLIEHIKDTDIVICMENLIHEKTANSAEALLWFVEELGSEHVGICLDTGHLNLTEDKDQVKFIRTAGKHLKALHLADNDGTSDQHLMPCARGQINFKDVILETKKLGYDGIYNLEIPGERYEPLEIKGFKLEYVRNILNYYWNLSE